MTCKNFIYTKLASIQQDYFLFGTQPSGLAWSIPPEVSWHCMKQVQWAGFWTIIHDRSLSFFTAHSSNHITYFYSLTVYLRYFLVQFNCIFACSSVNNACFAALHLWKLTSWSRYWIVHTDTFVFMILRNSVNGIRVFASTVRMM